MDLLQASLVLLIYCVLPLHGYDYYINANNGSVDSNLDDSESSSIVWIKPLLPKPRIPLITLSGPCSYYGVLKLDFDAEDDRSKKEIVQIDMWLDNPRGISFNIGDASDNNGLGASSSTSSRDAEISGLGCDLFIKTSDGRSTRNEGELINSTLVRIVIADGVVIWNSLGEDNILLGREYLFALGNQTDDLQDNPHDAIYFGINRRVGPILFPSFLVSGRGLCQAEITWLDWFEAPGETLPLP